MQSNRACVNIFWGYLEAMFVEYSYLNPCYWRLFSFCGLATPCVTTLLSGPLNQLNAILSLLLRDHLCHRECDCEALSRSISHHTGVLNHLVLNHLGSSTAHLCFCVPFKVDAKEKCDRGRDSQLHPRPPLNSQPHGGHKATLSGYCLVPEKHDFKVFCRLYCRWKQDRRIGKEVGNPHAVGLLEVFTEDAFSAFSAHTVGEGGCVDCGIGILPRDASTHLTLIHLPIRSVFKGPRVFSLPKFVYPLSHRGTRSSSGTWVMLRLASPKITTKPRFVADLPTSRSLLLLSDCPKRVPLKVVYQEGWWSFAGTSCRNHIILQTKWFRG